MKKLEISLNILHYSIYRAHYNLHLFANKINPFNLIHKMPFQKRRYEELGIDIYQEINRAFGDKKNGLSIMIAGGVLFGVLFLLLFDFALVLLNIVNSRAVLSTGCFIVFGFVSAVACYLFVFKKNKYLEYFKNFEGWSKSKKRKYGWISFIFIATVFVLFFVSLS